MDGKKAPFRGYGDRIRILRERAGITVEELAQAIGVAPYFIRRTELSEVYPTKPYIDALADALQISADYLARHIWTGESLKVITKGVHADFETMQEAYTSAIEQSSIEQLERQLEERMRVFDLLQEVELKRRLEQSEDDVAMDSLVDAVLELGRSQIGEMIVPFARYVERLAGGESPEPLGQYRSTPTMFKSYRLQA